MEAGAEALLDQALGHFRAKRTAQARAAFDGAIHACASRGGLGAEQLEMVHSMRGDCHGILGDTALAAEDFGRSIELAPHVAIYRYKRGSARRKLGDSEGAAVDLRRSIEMGCGLGKAELQRLEAASAARHRHDTAAETAPAPHSRSPEAGRTKLGRSHHRKREPAGGGKRDAAADTASVDTAEAEAVLAQLAVVEREQERLVKLTARVVGVALTDGERERSGRLAAERAVQAEQQRVLLAKAKAHQYKERARSERRAAKTAEGMAEASKREAAKAQAEAAGQRDRVAHYLAAAQLEISSVEHEAAERTAAMEEEGQRRAAAREEQAARQRVAATAVLRQERAARHKAAEAQATAEGRLKAAEAQLATAQREATTAAAAAQPAVPIGGAGECVICLDAPKATMLEPCRHVCLCEACAPRVKECPVCRAKVRRRTRLYL